MYESKIIVNGILPSLGLKTVDSFRSETLAKITRAMSQIYTFQPKHLFHVNNKVWLFSNCLHVK